MLLWMFLLGLSIVEYEGHDVSLPCEAKKVLGADVAWYKTNLDGAKHEIATYR